jgi:5'-nucleotidase
MNILLTNDDGIDSPGLLALADVLSPVARLWVCAPKTEQSGCGHGLTVREPLKVRDETVDGAVMAWSVEGKPGDCVKIALLTLMQEPVDIVLSGINQGANLGTDTLYSGTVAAALEAAVSGIPAIALSLAVSRRKAKSADFGQAAQIGAALYKRWEAGDLPVAPRTALNVNIPYQPGGGIKGFKLARLGVQHYSDVYTLTGESEGYRQYMLSGERLPSHNPDPDLDIVAVADGYVTLTPLSTDRTDYKQLRELEGLIDHVFVPSSSG